MLRLFRLFLVSLVLPAGGSLEAQPVQLVNAFPGLTFTRPLFLTHAGDGTDRVFVVQQDGIIKVFPNDSTVTSPTTFLNIRNKLSNTTGEEGLLGLAFHPDYENNGYFYVNYTAPGPLRTVVARYSVRPEDPNRADSLSELVIITVNQPFSNHNGGMILFGSDDYLYIGMGDGGSGGDPQGNGQNLQTLLGKILRIDIDTTVGARNYGIPPDNPFAGNPSAGREEIYAWGFRNPWRFSLDEPTNFVYVGDVGQNAWEEVDILMNGLNYGWRCYEGNAPYNTSGCGSITQYTFPIKVYSHAGGNCSVTGGYVYHGYRKPALEGAYIYGDYCSGQIWMLRYEGGQLTADSLLVDATFPVSSFGVDREGELYLCNYNGNIQRFAGPSRNNPPTAFNLISPPDDTTFTFAGITPSVTFTWEESVDPEQDPVTYTIEIDTISSFASGAFRDTAVGPATGATLPFERISQTWFWRVRASDGDLSVLSTGYRFFDIDYINAAPSSFDLVFPPDDTTMLFFSDPTIDFSWEISTDPDSDAVSYILQIDTVSTFDSPALRDSLAGGATTHTVTFPQTPHATYYWRVKSTDGLDTVLSSTSRRVNVTFSPEEVAQEEDLPKESTLDQNFPNPFNPLTTIKYALPAGGHVRLTVFNLLGQMVSVLFEGAQPAGEHTVEFSSGTLPSGIYFYRIEAPGFVETKKMVIAK